MFTALITALSLKAIRLISALGYWGIGLGMAIESCNIPLPSEAILPFGGYLVSTGRLSFVGAVAAGTIGGLVGSLASYYIGYYGGRVFLEKYGKYIGISKHRLAQADAWFAHYGNATVFLTRLLPGVRTFISLPAGAARMNVFQFIIYTLAGSLIWGVLLTYIGYILGDHWETITPWFHRLDLVVVIGILLVIAYFVWRRLKKKRH